MQDILKQIVHRKRIRINEEKQSGFKRLTQDFDPAPRRKFTTAFNNQREINIIAEIKKASPSAGLLRAQFNSVDIAKSYEANGAVAISVLTEEEFFLGSLEDLKEAARSISLPVLRKDFIIDEYQIHESKSAGASAILLIVSILEKSQLKSFLELSEDCGLDALVEAHTLQELETALSAGAKIVGINNRDLASFQVRLETSLDLAKNIPDNIVKVSESGIRTYADLTMLRHAGYDGFLIGEEFMRAKDPGIALKSLRESA